LDNLCESDTIDSCLSDLGGFIDTGVTLSLLDCIWYVGRDEVGEIGCTGASDIGRDCVTGGDAKGWVTEGYL
jgi:hypothetical protein